MKKILLGFLIIISAAANSLAQKGVHGGLGFNYNTVWIINQNSYGQAEYEYALDMGTALRFDVGYNITDHIGFETGVVSFKSGQKYDESHGLDLHREVKMKYTGIPLLFKFTGGKGNVKFYAFAGPQFSFLNSAELTGAYAATDASTLTNAKVRFEKNNTGLNFGLGANITLTPFLYMNAGMAFLYGFSDINAASGSGPDTYLPNSATPTWQWPSHNTNSYEPSNLANGGFSIGIHYLYGMGK